MNTKIHLKALLGAAAVLWLAEGAAQAQINSLTVFSSTPVTNALGRNLAGTGGVSNGASRVEIRQLGAGIQPPNPDTHEGNEFANPWVRTTYLGYGVLGANPGCFSEEFKERLPDGSYFARVYDAEFPANALYYADSLPFAAPDKSVSSLEVEFGALKLVNGDEDVDTDGDGIPDAMENERTGTIASEWDSDKDGWDDRFEVLNDTLDPNESTPIEVAIHAPEPEVQPPLGHAVSWWTLPGVAYRLEFHPDQADATNYVEVLSGAAPGSQMVEDVDWVLDESPTGFFRVKAFPYGMP